jgi:hypothetical protein
MNIYVIKIRNNISGIYDNISNALDFSYGLINSNLITKNEKIIIQKYKINTCILLEELIVDLNYNIAKKNNINYSQINDIYEADTELSTTENDTELNSTEYDNNQYINTLDDNQYATQDDNQYATQDGTQEEESINTEQEELNKKLKREFLDQQTKLGQEKIKLQHEINLLKEKQKEYDEALILYNSDLELYNKFKKLKIENTKFVIPNMFEDKYKIFEKLELDDKLDFENFINQYKPSRMVTSFDDLFESQNYSKINTVNELDSENDIQIYAEYESDTDIQNVEPFTNVDINELYIATNQLYNEDVTASDSSSVTSSITTE